LEMVAELMPEYDGSVRAISYQVFNALVTNRSNDAFDPARLERYQDMNQPLCNYYIATSYHTFLEGEQLTSQPSLKRYDN